MKRLLTTFVALIAFTMLTACGGGGSPLLGTQTQNNPAPASGSVTLSIKDAPLSALQTFTIDVTKATLKGIGTSADAQIFPAPNSTASVTIDLLSVQGFNQLLGAQSVPAGTYNRIELEYSNPTAVDNQNVAQVITTQGTTVFGLFSPALLVSANSQQSIQVDVNLQSSVFDLGGNSLLFAPVILVDVLNQARPVKRFPGIVESTNVANDSFSAQLVFYGPNSTNAGRVTVQCDTMTTFNDGNGNVSMGGVPAKLTQGDLVEIDGSLLNSTVDASSVTLLGQATTGGSGGVIGNAPPAILGPPVLSIAGTLVSVDTNASTMTLATRLFHGPLGPNSATNANSGAMRTVQVSASTNIHRGGVAKQLGDLVPGNWFHILGSESQGVISARDVEEGPAFITGTITAVAQAGGANGQDRISFAPDAVDQTPASVLTFLPATLDVDVSAPHNFAANGRIQVIGFFVANSNLIDSRSQRGGMTSSGGSTGGGSNGGNTGGGVNAPPPAPSRYGIFGELSSSSSAAMVQNNIEFTLDLGSSAMSPNNATLDVIVEPSATITKVELVGNNVQTSTIQAAQAIADINSGNFSIEVYGSAAPVNGVFTADLEMNLISHALRNGPTTGGGPGGNTGGNTGGGAGGNTGGGAGGNTGGGNPGGNNNPPTTPHTAVIVGVVQGSATINASNELVFQLVGPNSPSNTTGAITVTVTANAIITLYPRPTMGGNGTGAGGAIGGGGNTQTPPSTLTLAQAMAELNANPTQVQVIGTFNPQTNVMNNVQEVAIFK